MFYEISFSEETVRRRRRWSLIRQGCGLAVTAASLLLVGYSYMPAGMRIYALSKEYSSGYFGILPRDIALSAAVPVVDCFRWTVDSRNRRYVEFLEALADDLQETDPGTQGKVIYRGESPELSFKGDLNLDLLPRVSRWVGSQAERETTEPDSKVLAAAKDDPLAKPYFERESTAIEQSGEEQKAFLNKNLKDIALRVWDAGAISLVEQFPQLRKRREEFFQINPQMTLDLMKGKAPELEKEWNKRANRPFSFRHGMKNEMDARVTYMVELGGRIPPEEDAMPLFGRVEWLLNLATNFMTATELESGRVDKRVLEIAGWAGFYNNPLIVTNPPERRNGLFSLMRFQVESAGQGEVLLRQYADFYKCLVNEPERFRVLSMSGFEVEVQNGTAFVNRFVLECQAAGVSPEKLEEFQKTMDEANRCLEDLRKMKDVLDATVRVGGVNHGG